MANTTTHSKINVVLDAVRAFFQHKRDQLRESMARRMVYRETVSELSALSNRELMDLGIPRSFIRRMAMEVAYDC